MRVLLVNYEYPGITTNCGGGGRFTELLADGLRDVGHDPLIVTDWDDGHYATFPVRSYREIARWLATADIDLVHGQFSIPSSLPLPRLCEQFDVPYLVTVMGADVYDPTRFRLIRPLADRLNQCILGGAERVLAPSSDMVHRVESKYDLACERVPFGINVDAWNWHPRDANEPWRVLSVCRLVERKNLIAAGEAVRRVRERGYDVEYTVVGTGPRAESLEAIHGHRGWYTLAGYVDDLRAVYADHDLFFLPSHHEAFGAVYLEALASGLPVVASNHGGQTDLICDGVGNCRPAPEDVNEQADALISVIEDYERYQRATRAYVERRFDLDNMVNSHLDVYEQILETADAGKVLV